MALGRLRRGRRAAERGATLSLIAFSTCIVLMTLGTTYVVAAQNMFLLSVERARLAQAREAAEAGLAIAGAAYAGSPAATSGSETLTGGAGKVAWEVVPAAGGDHATIHAAGSFGAGRDRVAVRLSALVERVAGAQRPRVLRITRE